MSLPHQPTRSHTVVISCGGTGGHLAPGIALAQELRARGHSTLLLVSKKGVDATLSSKYPDLRFEAAPGGAFSLHPVKFCQFLGSLFSSVRFFQKVLRREKPVAAVAFGGFTTGGLALAATLARVPLVLHEGNHIPGKAIRAFRPFARKVFAPNTFASGVIPLGFPLRPEFQARQRDAARDALGLPREGHLLVILGGSQGAKALSEWAAASAPALAAAGWNVLCQTGANTAPEATTQLPGPTQGAAFSETPSKPSGEAAPSPASPASASSYITHYTSHIAAPAAPTRLYRTTPFCHSMADLLSAADLAVARAGAGTIAELQACRLPAVLVPYPHAADNHQQANAQAAEALGGSTTLSQEKLSELLPLVLASAPGSARHQAWLAALHQPAENARERLADEVLSFTAPSSPTTFPVAALL